MLAIALLFLSTLAGAQQPRLLAGPDVLVSRENDFPHVEMMIADHPTDPRKLIAGSMALVGSNLGTIVYSSADGGSTWSPGYPAERIDTDADPLVLYTPRGTALYLGLPGKAIENAAGKRYMPVVLYRSEDDGRLWQKPLLLGTEGAYDHPQIAADPRSGRVYVSALAWTDFRSGRPQAMLTWSADRGKTWSELRPVAGRLPEGAYSFQPALAVNKDGVLGVSWLDTRAHPGTDRYDAYFSASLDGGATFLPAVRLSSESSDPLGAGNQRPSPMTFQDRNKTIRVAFLSALTRFSQGGDYAGLAADAEGHFHPLWPDSRTGTFQAWTTRVRLERGPAAPPHATPPQAANAAVDLREHAELTFDPATYDGETRELRLPIRIRNRSEKIIRGPLQVRVKAFGSGAGDMNLENTPTILNAANAEKGAGAVFDYSRAFGDFGDLEPGATTEPVVWRFRLVGAGSRTPDMHLEVTGQVDGN